jgi:hypothetical protein
VFYDLGPATTDDQSLLRFTLSGHTVAPRWGSPDDVQWYVPIDMTLEIKVVDVVPRPFVEVCPSFHHLF